MITICSPAPRTVASNGRVTAIENSGTLYRDGFSLLIDAGYTYSYELNGFGGPRFGPSSRQGGRAFEMFAIGSSASDAAELQLNEIQPLNRSAYGLTTFYDLCFFAGAPPATATPPAIIAPRFAGFVDGLSQTAADSDRLFGSTATLDFDAGRKAYGLTLRLAAVEEAFAEADGQAQFPLATATASLSYNPSTGAFEAAALTAPGGFTGTAIGFLVGPQRNVAVFSFEMTNPAGERIWGVAATEAS